MFGVSTTVPHSQPRVATRTLGAFAQLPPGPGNIMGREGCRPANKDKSARQPSPCSDDTAIAVSRKKEGMRGWPSRSGMVGQNYALANSFV